MPKKTATTKTTKAPKQAVKKQTKQTKKKAVKKKVAVKVEENMTEMMPTALVTEKPSVVPTNSGPPYRLMEKQEAGKIEIRLYPPQKRTIYNCREFFHVQFPWSLFAYKPDPSSGRSGGYLYGCFSERDISGLTPEELAVEPVFMMPFPKHFDRGSFGPCCLDWDNCYYQPDRLDLSDCIAKFWSSEFRGVSDYGQPSKFNAGRWRDLTLAQVYEILHASPKMYKYTYADFRQAVFGSRV